ncbi:unnamed protein product [Sphenostylis stenocarpa]|uniref:Uncharacterized protein n=1 Tax=Sphenostylis stenocarpa TaxID=92480 RepID=A0AA86VWR1_9FABA|nr:unnamed protein product [Sphenostylis stenocarpa]
MEVHIEWLRTEKATSYLEIHGSERRGIRMTKSNYDNLCATHKKKLWATRYRNVITFEALDRPNLPVRWSQNFKKLLMGEKIPPQADLHSWNETAKRAFLQVAANRKGIFFDGPKNEQRSEIL